MPLPRPDGRRSALLALGATALAGAFAVPASAATKVVYAGPPEQLAGAPRSLEVDAFFRRNVTVGAGDRVRWEMRGFHTITFVPRGTPAPKFVRFDPVQRITGYRDLTGRPFAFSDIGIPALYLGTGVIHRLGGDSYDGARLISSGIPPLNGTVRPYSLRFPTAGTYRYVCLTHPGSRNVANGMSGTITVLPRGSRVPSASADRAAARAQLASITRRARRLDRWRGPSGPRVEAGNDRTDGITLLRFFPRVKRIRAGQTVEFAIAPGSLSFHTVTFGPERALRPLRRQFTQTPGGPGRPPHLRVNPTTFFGTEPWALGSDPATPVPDYDGRNHGNGLLSLVAMDIDATPDSPNPRRTRMRFTRPGSYRFECLVHRGMTGRIDVSARSRAPSLPG